MHVPIKVTPMIAIDVHAGHALFTIVFSPQMLGYAPQKGSPFLATVGTFVYAFIVDSVEYVTTADEFQLHIAAQGEVHCFDMTKDEWGARLAKYLTENRTPPDDSVQSTGEIIELP